MYESAVKRDNHAVELKLIVKNRLTCVKRDNHAAECEPAHHGHESADDSSDGQCTPGKMPDVLNVLKYFEQDMLHVPEKFQAHKAHKGAREATKKHEKIRKFSPEKLP